MGKQKPKRKSKRTAKAKAPGNYIDSFVKRMFGRVWVFVDFLQNYADKKFVDAIDTTKIEPAPTHFFGHKGDERISDLIFKCPLKAGRGNLMAVIIFEHESKNLRRIPRKLLKYISGVWDAEEKAGLPLSAPYFIVLRTGKKPRRRRLYKMLDSLPIDDDGKPVGKTVEVEYDFVDLPGWDINDLKGGAVLRSTLMMLHKITGGNLDDFPDALSPLLELPEGEWIEPTKELIDFVAQAFAAKRRKFDVEAASAAVETIFKGKGKMIMKTIFDEREAIAEARGIARGEVKGKAEMVIKALRTKFKKIPKEIENAVFGMSDSIALESLLEHAIHSDTLDEFADCL